jgi:hypothetical protein
MSYVEQNPGPNGWGCYMKGMGADETRYKWFMEQVKVAKSKPSDVRYCN